MTIYLLSNEYQFGKLTVTGYWEYHFYSSSHFSFFLPLLPPTFFLLFKSESTSCCNLKSSFLSFQHQHKLSVVKITFGKPVFYAFIRIYF